MWELRRETLGYVWWYWPTLSGDDGWERVRGFQPARTAALAEEEARKWFCVNFAGLRVEITAGYQDTGARLAMGARS